MFKKFQNWALAFSVLSLSVVSSSPIDTPEYGITLRDTKERFTIFTEGSFASDIVEGEDGSVSWVATAAGGAGGGVAFYVKPTKEEINIANYDSIDVEFDYSIVEDHWTAEAQDPGFAMRMLPWDSTGMFGGYEELEYFDTGAPSGTFAYNIKIPSGYADRVIASSDFDSILGFALKFNDYQRGNNNGDEVKVTLKNVVFNAKEGAAEDEAFNDGLDDSQRGSVVEIFYPTKDYSIEEADLTEADNYEKHAWVYLPAGYDADDKDTKYPVFILLHGGGQDENTWGLSNKGRGGKIKGYMDRGMANGTVEKFVLVAASGIARKGYNYFGGELRNDLLPYLRANFNIKEGRDNVAIAGLSMGGIQTFDIGIGENLDIISHFGGYSGYSFVTPTEFIANIDNNEAYNGLKIHNLYLTCGTADSVYIRYPDVVDAFGVWDRVETFNEYTYIDGTHDFPVWFNGFNQNIQLVFKNNSAVETELEIDDEIDSEVEVTDSIEDETDSVSEDEN